MWHLTPRKEIRAFEFSRQAPKTSGQVTPGRRQCKDNFWLIGLAARDQLTGDMGYPARLFLIHLLPWWSKLMTSHIRQCLVSILTLEPHQASTRVVSKHNSYLLHYAGQADHEFGASYRYATYRVDLGEKGLFVDLWGAQTIHATV